MPYTKHKIFSQEKMMDQQSLHNPASSAQTDHVCLIQREFPCLDGQVILAVDQYEACWISVPSACKLLGVNARGQQQRIARTQELAQACQQIVLATRGGPQRITCLKVEQVSTWLSTMADAQPEQHLLFLQNVTDAASALRNEVQSTAHQELPLDEGRVIDIQESQAIARTLPGLGPILIVPSHAEDRAIREATLARQTAWREESKLGLPYYLASNQMRVYFGDPRFPLEPEEAQAALARLRESTIMTARYILGRWTIAREQGQLAQEGSVPIRIEEILEWRGIQKHSRAIAPGSTVRRIEDYEIKYRKQAQEDLRLLSQFWLRGTHQVQIKGQQFPTPVTIDSYYLRIGRLQNPENDRSLYYAAPGVWINTYEASGGLWLAELDRRIFTLHPQRHQIALRIALFLSEQWQLCLMNGTEITPLAMQELLARSMVSLDQNHLTSRFIPHVEQAIQLLIERGIVREAKPDREVSRESAQRGKEWLATHWTITPPTDVAQRHLQRARERTIGTSPSMMLLPSPDTEDPAEPRKIQGQKILHTPSTKEGER
jgi:hypothetical protein